MNLLDNIRNSMLEVLVNSTNATSADKKIHFFDDSDTLLCSMVFDSIETVQTGSRVSINFKYNSSSSLASRAVNSGVISKFRIQGLDPVTGLLADEAVRGTVGNLASQADVRLNRTKCNNGSILTISKFSIVSL